MFERITKAMAIPGQIVRNITRRNAPMNPWWLMSNNSNKVTPMGWTTYYTAMDQEWVTASIGAIITEILGMNFNIERSDKEPNTPYNEEYLIDLFQFPEGHEMSIETYTSFMWKMWASFLGTGDAFAEVATNDANSQLAGGLYFLPPHVMTYYTDTAQWGYVASDTRFEDDELIHVKRPDPWNNTWGKSLIDVIAGSLTADVLAWKFNRDFFKSGMHPRGMFTFDASKLSKSEYDEEIDKIRMTAKNNERGNLFMYGGSYEDLGVSNKDMEFMELTNAVRDKVLAVYGVPGQKVGVYTSGNLGDGRDESADQNFWKKRSGEIKLFEDAFNNVIGKNNDWKEEFIIPTPDLENKLLRAQVSDLRIRNGSLLVNEDRKTYDLEPTATGDTPFPMMTGTPAVMNPTEQGVKRYLQEKGLLLEV